MKKTFDVAKAITAQVEYCNAGENRPHFAPKDGYCWACKQNIYAFEGYRKFFKDTGAGISVEEAGTKLITGCPFCNRSYCD